MNKKSIILHLAILIAILNVFDGFATFLGIENNYIEELNPMMNYLLTVNPIFFLAFKIGLSVVMIVISYFVYKHSKGTFQKLFFISLVGISFMYSGIFGLHMLWITAL